MESSRLVRNSVAVSLVIHAIVFAFLLTWGQSQWKSRELLKRDAITWVDLTKTPVIKPIREKESDTNKTQVVRTQETEKSDHAAKDAYLSHQTQTVERETVADERKGEARAEQPIVAHAPEAQTAADMAKPKGKLGRFGISYNHAKENLDDVRNQTVEKLSQVGNPGEYLKGIAKGERTLLNTKEYVFFGYFERIRSRLDQAWEPYLKGALSKLYEQGRQLASEMDHTTRVFVTLNGSGEIIQVQLMEESGTRDLDQAAIQAFQRAGPFPNPPKGLVEADGKVRISWEFILKT